MRPRTTPTGSLFPSSATVDSTANHSLLRLAREDGGSWIVADDASTVYGHGKTLLEALCDFHAALFSHLSMLDHPVLDDARLSGRMQAHKQRIEWLLERAS